MARLKYKLKMSEILNDSLASKLSFICLKLFHTQMNMNLAIVIPEKQIGTKVIIKEAVVQDKSPTIL